MTKSKSSKGELKGSSKEALSSTVGITGVHVLRAPVGGWYVKLDGKPSAVDRFSTKKEAVRFARSLKAGSFPKETELAVRSTKADVFVHDGLVFETKSFKSGKVSRPELPRARRPKHRTFGSAKGRIKMANDFDETPSDFADYIE